MSYDIESFWKRKLASAQELPALSLPGWETQNRPYEGFVEAELLPREEHTSTGAPIWLVSAPGAVGKSTLAKQIAAETGSIYLDLSQAATVAGNYLTGGLVNNGIFEVWQADRCTVLIDALDEARLRVTQDSFEHFLTDVYQRSNGRGLPTVLFGRVGIVDEAWLILQDYAEIDCPILDIQFFDTSRAISFVEKNLDSLAKTPRYSDLRAPLQKHRGMYKQAATQIIYKIEDVTRHDGSQFAGYAPVLEAVARVIASETNPASLNQAVSEELKKEVLRSLSEQIMDREATKVRHQLPDEISGDMRSQLYTPDEQVSRLTRLVYGESSAPRYVPPKGYESEYNDVVQRFIGEHPFLDGTGKKAANSVFGALINVAALFDHDRAIVERAGQSVESDVTPPNPFLIDFYIAEHKRVHGSMEEVIPPEHLVILYESAASRQGADQAVYLNVEADEESDWAEAEIQTVESDNAEPHRTELKVSQAGVIRFPSQIRGVFIDAPSIDIDVGRGSAVEVIAPVAIDAARISFQCSELTVYPPEGAAARAGQSFATLRAGSATWGAVVKPPRIRGNVSFGVSWPGDNAHPWLNYALEQNGSSATDVDEYLRRFAKIVIAFRSHSKGSLARLKDKIDHHRMSKGPGAAIRDQLVADGVITSGGRMYYLHPERLGSVVGATFEDVVRKSFSEKTVEYLRAIANK